MRRGNDDQARDLRNQATDRQGRTAKTRGFQL